MQLPTSILAMTLLMSTLVHADTALPQPGLYQVRVTLELPHVIDANTAKDETICLGADKAHAYGLRVLSENNPLGSCPLSAVSVTENELAFDVACSGVNAARGHASYRFSGGHFEGRIDMKMGGKNMTMTEVQSGHRVGDCEPDAGH